MFALHSRPFRFGLTGVLFLWANAGCRQEATAPRPSRTPPAPNILMIVMDTVRADHLGSYGYPIRTTPALDAFAARATRYAQVLSTSSWTLPSHASLFTGLYPFEHGAHGFDAERDAKVNYYALPESHETLATFLAARGYRTAAFTANAAFMHRGTGLDRGFDAYYCARINAAQINRAADRFLQRRDGRPFFLFLNYMDAHRPYTSAERPGLLPRKVTPDPEAAGINAFVNAVAATGTAPPALRQGVIDHYDTGIAAIDEAIGSVISRLESIGQLESTWVIVTSDHGEFFGEHGLAEHSKDLYQPVLHVPLLVRRPGQRSGEVVETLTSLVDVPRLIFDAMPQPLAREAAAKFPHTIGTHPVMAELYYSRLKDLRDSIWGNRFNRIRRCIVETPLKYVESSDGKNELYDLSRDPEEAHDLASVRPADAQRLADRLAAWMKERRAYAGPHTPARTTRADRRALETLGYVGSADENAEVSSQPGSQPASAAARP